MKAPKPRGYANAFSQTVLACIFAIAAVAANTFETWFPGLEAEEGEETQVTVRLPARYFRITMLRSEFHYLDTTSSTCPHLVPRGTKLQRGKECTGLVVAYQSHRDQMSPFHLAGLFVFYLLVGIFLSTFMRYASMGRSRLLRSQITLFMLLIAGVGIAKAILLLTALPALILPVAAIPLLTRYFFRKRIAYIVAFATSMVVASLINFDIEHFLVFLFSSLAVVSSKSNGTRAWIQLKRGAQASWVAALVTVVTTLIFSGTLDIHDDLTEHVDPRYSLWISAIIGGMGSGLLAFIATPVVGKCVGEVARTTLLDLQDLNQRLLTLLRERAPGTWEHSRAMANLAEAAANSIGSNALLARIGAYYHDIGKAVGSEFFIENQAGGPNPHDELEPYDSAMKIHRHVVEGTKMLRKEGIPEDVIEFCYSHHGTSVLEYFWHKNMAEGNPEDLAEKDFCYPGYIPTTRETGIVMLVDAIEAAARTVEKPEKTAFQTLVQRILFSKLSQGQLDQTGLSLADLRVVSNTLVDTLVNMYHARIKYPWQTTETGSTPASTIDLNNETADEDNEKDASPAGKDDTPSGVTDA